MTNLTAAEVEYVMEQAWQRATKAQPEMLLTFDGVNFFRSISEEMRLREQMTSPAGLKRLFPGIH